MSLAPGLYVTPTIRLARLLKQGGMGSVWVADHLALHTQVAVKFMSPQLVQSPAAVTRFTREATAAAQIKSPHVVQILDHGVTSERVPYIVMELLEGEELGKRIKRAGPLGLKDASKVVTETARALGRAHALGIVHRDIKPDNVFLLDIDGEPFVKVLDFGIAKQREDESQSFGLTTTGSMVGTPYYMSPEQLLSAKHVDLRSDLWSVGVVTYRMLTGKVPFRGETLGALCVAIEKGVYAMPSTLRPGLPASVDTWCLRALARDPAARFGSAKELADAFAASIVGAPDLPPPSLGPSSMRDPFTPAPGTGASGSFPSSPSASGGAVVGSSGAYGAMSSSGAGVDVLLGEATGPSVHPTFNGATRTSPGPSLPPRRRSMWMLAGVLAGLTAGGAAALYVVGGRALSASSDKSAAASAPSALPTSAAIAAAEPAPAPPAAVSSASASAAAPASATSEAASPPPPAADAREPAPTRAPAAAIHKPSPSRPAAAKPGPAPSPATPPPAEPAKPKERDRGF